MVVLADVFLASLRSVSTRRLAVAFVFATVLVWGLAGFFGWMGSRITFNPDTGRDQFARDMSVLPGLIVGTTIGSLVGAMLGIAFADRAMMGAWPRPRAVGLAAATFLALGVVVLYLFLELQSGEEKAGRAVYVVFPLLGAAPVLGWLLGLRKTPT